MTVTAEKNYKLYEAGKWSVVGFASLVVYLLFKEFNKEISA